MNKKEHQEYIQALRDYSKKVLESEEETKRFFVKAGIHTPTGKLTKVYSHTEEPKIGYSSGKNHSK